MKILLVVFLLTGLGLGLGNYDIVLLVVLLLVIVLGFVFVCTYSFFMELVSMMGFKLDVWFGSVFLFVFGSPATWLFIFVFDMDGLFYYYFIRGCLF